MIQRLDMPRQTIEPSLVDGYDIPVLLVSQYQIFLFLHSISKITVERQSSYSAGLALRFTVTLTSFPIVFMVHPVFLPVCLPE